MRIALVVPANNTTMEAEVGALAPAGAAIRVVRVARGPGLLTAADIPAYKETARQAVAPLAEERPDLVLYGCTAAGILAGREGDAAFAAELEESIGAPVVSTAGAMVEILRREGAGRVAVVSPYSDEVNARLRDFAAAGGIAVATLESLAAADVAALGRITSEDVRARAETLDPADADALFIACSQLPTLGIVEGLRRHRGGPVWTSILATATLGLERIGATANAPA